MLVNVIKGEILELLVRSPEGCISQSAAERFNICTDWRERRNFAGAFPDPTSTILTIITKLAEGIAKFGGKIDRQTIDDLLENGIIDITEYAMVERVIK